MRMHCRSFALVALGSVALPLAAQQNVRVNNGIPVVRAQGLAFYTGEPRESPRE